MSAVSADATIYRVRGVIHREMAKERRREE